jgi:DNA polymerase-1
MIIGEAPGKNEDLGIPILDDDGNEIDRVWKPFVGAAGNLLNKLLEQAGLKREDIFITNVIKRRPPENKIGQRDALIEIANNIPALMREIRIVKPRVIVPLGNTALHALGFSRYKIGNVRGTVIPSPYGKIIPSWHPAFIFRQYQERFTAERDWQKIARHSKTASIPQFTEHFELNPTVDDVERFEMMISNKVRAGQKVSIALDLETEYIEGSSLLTPIKLIGMALTDSHAIVIPLVNQQGERYWTNKDEELRVIKAVGDILENPAIELMSHNSLFDILVLMNHGFKIKAKLYDTMIAHSLYYLPSKHGLDYVASLYTDFPPWKQDIDHTDEGYRYYNAKDCTVLKLIRPKLDEDLKTDNLTFLCSMIMDTILPTCDMMLNGLAIDAHELKRIDDELQGKLDQLTQELRDLAMNPALNIDSPTQISNVLFKQMKLRSQVKTKGKQLSTSNDVLNRLSLRYPDNEFVKKMQEYRHYSHQRKNFTKDIYVHVDGRVHSSFRVDRVATGRYSSSDPNLQNLPARQDPDGFIRGLYKVPLGRILVTADYSQLELMIFAELAQDPEWLEAFRTGQDVHVINGKALLGKFYDPKYRTFTKNFIYGLIYGSEGGEVEKVAPKELIQYISVPQMMENLKQKHPSLFAYREEIEEQMNSRHYVMNAFGRRRYFPKMKLTKADMRSAYNHPIQSTAADIMHTRTPMLYQTLNPDTDKLVLQLHDAFYVETEDRRVDEVARILKSVMEEHISTPMGYEFDLTADVDFGTSLAKKDLQPWNSH